MCIRDSSSIVPKGHPLAVVEGGISLSQLSRYPIITYGRGYTGRAHIDEAFARAGITPDILSLIHIYVYKRQALPHFKSALELALMRRVKQALDPLNLMNPGKVLSLSLIHI